MTRNLYSALTTGTSEQHGLVRLCIVFLVLQMIIRTDTGHRSLCFPFLLIFWFPIFPLPVLLPCEGNLRKKCILFYSFLI
jgi:hypothetical protein